MTTHALRRKALSVLTAVGLLGGSAVFVSTAQAYTPTANTLFEMSTSDKTSQQNKYNSIVYPKAAVTTSGRILAAHELSIGQPVGQTLPIYKSDDSGNTWSPYGTVESPAHKVATGETLRSYTAQEATELAKYTSAWTNPYLYVLPEDVGDLKQGDILLAMLVSGDDMYYQEQKAENPNWTASADGDRQDLAIALYVSSKASDGESWKFVDIIDEGGWQANYGATFSSANALKQQDPVWEPYLMVYAGKLVAYYTDEKDYTGYDSITGELTLRSDWETYQVPSTGKDSGNQVLVHREWDGSLNSEWGARILDEGGSIYHGELGGGRPGMANVVETTDGKWIYTAEFGVAKVSDSPLRFWDAEKPAKLPVSNWGSPVIIQVPDPADPAKWGLLLNHGSSGDVWYNASGHSDGDWVRLNTALGSGFSRNLTYVPETGKVLILRAGWDDNKIQYAHLDVGNSEGSYYRLVNQDGQVLTQTASGEGGPGRNLALLKLSAADAGPSAGHQLWHLQPKSNGTVTLLAKSSGRALAVWGSKTDLTTWVDDNGNDKLWTLSQPNENGYRTIVGSSGQCVTASGTTQAQLATCADSASQLWRVELDPPSLDDSHNTPGTVSLSDGSLVFNALRSGPGTTEYNVNTSARVLAYQDGTFLGELGTVSLDSAAHGKLTLTDDLPTGTVQIALAFDDAALLWDTVDNSSGAGLTVTTTVTNRCVAKKVVTVISVTNTNAESISVNIESEYGAKNIAGLPAGATQSHSFSTRLATTAISDATVTTSSLTGENPIKTTTPIAGTTCN